MQIEGLDELMGRLDNIADQMSGDKMYKAFGRGVEGIRGRAAEGIRGRAVGLCPVNTGELRQSIFTKTTRQNEEFSGVVYTNKEYAPYVEFGTGPVGQEKHDGISPNANPVYKQKGWTYFDEETQSFVHTKGQAAQPYMYPAFKDGDEIVINEMQKTAAKVMKEQCK